MLCSMSTQPGYSHPSISSSGITFSRNIHPKQPGYHLTCRASLPFPPAPWSGCGCHSQGSSAKEIWQLSNFIGLIPRYLLLERSLCFFGIYTFKSKLQKKASVSILSLATLQSLQTLKSPGSPPIPAPRHMQDNTYISSGQFRGKSCNKQPNWGALWSYRHHGILRNQTHIVTENRQSVIAKGRCTFDKKCTKFITVTFSILGHVIYSVVCLFPNYNLCLFIRLQKLPLELSVLIKYQLFKNCYIYSLTPVCNKLHRIIGTSKA